MVTSFIPEHSFKAYCSIPITLLNDIAGNFIHLYNNFSLTIIRLVGKLNFVKFRQLSNAFSPI